MTKHYLLDSFVKSEGITWRDTRLESLDLEYHQVDPSKSLLAGLPAPRWCSRVCPALAKRDFFIQPPPNTRANLRSEAMRTIPAQAPELRHRLGPDLHRRGEADPPRRSLRSRLEDAQLLPPARASMTCSGSL
ncbi:MAG: proteasome accessory factor PafA2 family protein [Verrucomicrobiota bacterium]